MKYFTSEWWESGGEDEAVIEKYREYYESISSRLPGELRKLEDNHTLHDANVTSISADLVDNQVTVSLQGWDRYFNHPVNYEITFTGVTRFTQSSLPIDAELVDLGYWEYEIINGNIEMRMLFASGAQFSIEFNDFRFTHVQVKA